MVEILLFVFLEDALERSRCPLPGGDLLVASMIIESARNLSPKARLLISFKPHNGADEPWNLTSVSERVHQPCRQRLQTYLATSESISTEILVHTDNTTG